MTTTTQVKMCKKPDGVCLQGGCGYCSDGSDKTQWWDVRALGGYANRRGLMKDYLFGRNSNWPNREKKVA